MSDGGKSPVLMYNRNPRWADITPEEFENYTAGVVNIAYPASFVECFTYLRAVLKSGELSERVFELTGDCVLENASCYTVWLLRRRLIKHLNRDLRQEIDYMTSQISSNQKNYQVWYHRQKIVEWLGDPSGELEFIESMLEDDPKNYHAWQYRQWLIRTFNLWSKELEYCNKMIAADCRNNSAWNQRFFVIKNTTKMSLEVIDEEIDFVIQTLRKVNANESAWNYLLGILEFAGHSQKLSVITILSEFRSTGCGNIYLLSTMLDIYESLDERENAIAIVSALIKEDVLRSQYWLFRKQSLESGR